MFDRGLIIVSGKGGVGKSAVAAAIARRSASHGRKVLAMAARDAAGLASHLGQSSIGYEPEEVDPGLFITAIDLPSALTEYLQLQLRVPTPGFGMVARAFDVLASTAPGIREIITIGKVVYEVGRNEWDLVVVDAPPTGQIGSYLRAPRTVSDLVPSGRVREQSEWMESILAADTTKVVLVSLPEELPVRETQEAAADLQRHQGLGPQVIIANRVLPRLGIGAARIDELEPGPLQEAARHHQSLYAGQFEWLTELQPDVRLPYLFGLLTPSEVSARLSEELPEPGHRDGNGGP
jgi:anion-transporting  ArsA/GET3 family ATPase